MSEEVSGASPVGETGSREPSRSVSALPGFDPARVCATLERAATAINDWVVTYASDMCSDEALVETRQRIRGEGGTLYYASVVMSEIRGLISDIKDS